MTENPKVFQKAGMEADYESLRSKRSSGAFSDAAGNVLVKHGLVAWMSRINCQRGLSPPPDPKTAMMENDQATRGASERGIDGHPELTEILTSMIKRLCVCEDNAGASRHSTVSGNTEEPCHNIFSESDFHAKPPRSELFQTCGKNVPSKPRRESSRSRFANEEFSVEASMPSRLTTTINHNFTGERRKA